MSILQSTARHFLASQAAREIKKELEKIDKDRWVQILTGDEKDIVATYLKGCSAKGIAESKQKLNHLLQMGVTVDLILEKLIRQMPELLTIIEGREDYLKGVLKKLISVLMEG